VWGAAAISRSACEWLALGLILLVGIPHGAFDLRISSRRWGSGARSRVVVSILYLLTGGLMGAVCLLWPLVGLLVFLAVSVAHFAAGEAEVANRSTAAAVGVGSILFPIVGHADAAAGYFVFFLTSERFMSALPVLQVIAGGIAAVIPVLWWREARRGRGVNVLEWGVCLISWLALPPLAGFSVWFIGRHCRMHYETCLRWFPSPGRGAMFDVLVISVAAIALLTPLALRFDLTNLGELFAASIVLIAGLTVPHMVVTSQVAGLRMEAERSAG
jgi:Brp/Blh family beta-carotene 15,15'-monooxygenase